MIEPRLSLVEPVIELIRRTSVDLPADVEAALRRARSEEEEGSSAAAVLDTILQNVQLAREKSLPLCQDTGTNIFYVYHPEGVSTRALAADVREAVAAACERTYLRPNAVHPITGANSGNNLGREQPTIHFEEWDRPELVLRLMLKGGGCENVGAQYRLPDARIGAGRDLDGVKRAVLDCVQQAQGEGCAPGILGVCIGGDRSSGYAESKRQLFRRLDDVNPEPALRRLEEESLALGNALGIGPMGFGGRTTLLGVKIGWLHRLPASYFVTVSYMCWECRRRTLTVQPGGDYTID